MDTAGNAYVFGSTTSTDFPTTAGAFQTTFSGGSFDTFVTKLNPTGTALVYSTYLGGTGYDFSAGIAVDTAGNAYVTGYTSSTDFPTTAGAYQTSYGGGDYDAFVTKLNPTGTALVYSTYLGGTGFDQGTGIAVDTTGNVYVTGITGSTNFPTTPGAFQSTYAGGSYDAFVTKLNPTGTALVYSTYLGGTSVDEGTGIAVDTAGNTFVTGYTGSTDFPTTAGAFQTSLGSLGGNAFVTKLNSTGTALVYSTYLGGTSSDGGTGIALDPAGNAYVTGFTTSTDFPTTADGYQTTYGGDYDAFVAKFALGPVNLTVNTLGDDPGGPTTGQTTLRDAITQANADPADSYVINFSSGLQGTIHLTSALPDLSNNIALNGPGASDLTVQRDPSAVDFSVLVVNSGVTVDLSGLTITGGDAGSGNGGAGPARTLGGLGNLGCLRPDRFIGIPFSVLLYSRRRTENNRWQTAGMFPWTRS